MEGTEEGAKQEGRRLKGKREAENGTREETQAQTKLSDGRYRPMNSPVLISLDSLPLPSPATPFSSHIPPSNPLRPITFSVAPVRRPSCTTPATTMASRCCFPPFASPPSPVHAGKALWRPSLQPLDHHFPYRPDISLIWKPS